MVFVLLVGHLVLFRSYEGGVSIYPDPESIKDIIEISGFRTNYKKQYEYKFRYKYRSSYNWVSSSEVEDNPRNKNIFIKYINNNRKPVSISYNF